MLTLNQLLLSARPYIGENLDEIQRVNRASFRLLSRNDGSAKQRTVFNVFPDDDSNGYLTLGGEFSAVRGAQLCGAPLPIYNGWYRYSAGGVGLSTCPDGFEPLEGEYVTFRDWSSAATLRFTFASGDEQSGTIIVKGKLADTKIYSQVDSDWIEGIEVSYTGTTVNTAQTFDEAPYFISKPKTRGAVNMYYVISGTATLAATFLPNETTIGWRRYRVPVSPSWTESDPGQYTCICKRKHLELVSDNDAVYPANVEAFVLELQSMAKADSEDWARAKELSDMADKALADMSENETGASTESKIQMSDDFDMAAVGAQFYGDSWYPYGH